MQPEDNSPNKETQPEPDAYFDDKDLNNDELDLSFLDEDKDSTDIPDQIKK